MSGPKCSVVISVDGESVYEKRDASLDDAASGANAYLTAAIDAPAPAPQAPSGSAAGADSEEAGGIRKRCRVS